MANSNSVKQREAEGMRRRRVAEALELSAKAHCDNGGVPLPTEELEAILGLLEHQAEVYGLDEDAIRRSCDALVAITDRCIEAESKGLPLPEPLEDANEPDGELAEYLEAREYGLFTASVTAISQVARQFTSEAEAIIRGAGDADAKLEDIRRVAASMRRTVFSYVPSAIKNLTRNATQRRIQAIVERHVDEALDERICFYRSLLSGTPPQVAQDDVDAGVAHRERDETIAERQAERKGLRDAYKTECKKAGVTVTDEMIATEASSAWHTRDAIQKWLMCDPRYDGPPDRLIRAVFNKKPHLAKISPGHKQ